MIASSCHKVYFADTLGLGKYRLLKEHYKQILPELLQSHTSVRGFYMIYAAFHLFSFRQEKITEVHENNVLSFVKN